MTQRVRMIALIVRDDELLVFDEVVQRVRLRGGRCVALAESTLEQAELVVGELDRVHRNGACAEPKRSEELRHPFDLCAVA